MRIAIDTQTTMGQRVGMGFYVSNLVKSLQKIAPENQYILISPKRKGDFSMPQRWWWDQARVPLTAQKQRAEILHQPCFSAPLLWRGKLVMTVHDLILVFFPENIPIASRFFFSRWMPFTYRRADQIIVDSLSTKKDLVKVTDISEAKITTIYLGVEEVYRQNLPKEKLAAVKKRYQTGEKFILHVGTIEPRKNLKFLVEVFSEAIKRHSLPYNLVITGKRGWYYEGIFQRLKELGLEKRVIFTGYLPEDDLPALYQAANLFVFPSLYEGFGLPPLEAMASGTPVISSDTSSLPEVVGEAGLLLPPDDRNGWVKAINAALTDSRLAEKLAAGGRQQATKFSWDKCGQETLEVYQKLYIC